MLQGTICLQSLMNPALFSERGSHLPNSVKSDSGSSVFRGILPTGGSIPQTEAAALTWPRTSFTDGRSARSVCQHSSSRRQTLLERPSSGAFTGFDGLAPPKTLNTTSDPDSLPNGSSPVSTCTGGIGKGVLGVVWHVPGISPLPSRIHQPLSKEQPYPVRTWMGQGVPVP